jgi:hypothetical protein
MPQIKSEWEEIPEFIEIASKLKEKYPERFDHVNVDLIIAYKCTNKTKPDKKSKLYDMTGQTEPEAFTNPKKYFIKVFHDTWDNLGENNRVAIAFSAMSRISVDDPESGKVEGYDMHDQSFMARTLGVDWQTRADIPNLLRESVNFVSEPIVS